MSGRIEEIVIWLRANGRSLSDDGIANALRLKAMWPDASADEIMGALTRVYLEKLTDGGAA